jgi:hypothetical protein
MEQASQAQQSSPIAFDDSQCDWSPPQLTLDKNGAKTTIAGLSAAPVSILVKQSCKHRQTGAVCEVALSFEGWVAPISPGAQEAQQFWAAYAQQMGFADQGSDTVERARPFFGRYKDAWVMVGNEIRKIEGFAIKTQFALGLGGNGCNGPADGAGASASDTPSPAAIANQIAGMFGRNKAPPDDPGTGASISASGALSGMMVPLRMTSELSSIVSGPVSPGTFEVPAGFKK